jgi:hypothetical protein
MRGRGKINIKIKIVQGRTFYEFQKDFGVNAVRFDGDLFRSMRQHRNQY